MYLQQTIINSVSCFGIGLHSGKPATLTMKPAPVNHGIKFIRIDIAGKPSINAHYRNVVDTSLATVIRENNCIVSTIEHIMACLSIMLIDNIIIEIDSYEIPIMDGSSKAFIELIQKSGIKKQNHYKLKFSVKKPIKLIEDDKSIIIYPYPTYKISCIIKYSHPLIKKQFFSYNILSDYSDLKIGPARTFTFSNEIINLKEHGLAKGGSLENAIVLDMKKIINKSDLNFKNEFIRHKILDFIGDFALIGKRIKGHIIIDKPGHTLNYNFIKKIYEEKESWKGKNDD